MPTTKEVAEWMSDEFRIINKLYQSRAARHIKSEFGAEFIYKNENGNPAIDKAVLKEFKALTPEAFWDRSAFCWRLQTERDVQKAEKKAERRAAKKEAAGM